MSEDRRFGILADWQIRNLCRGPTPMISPFVDELISEMGGRKARKVISYGLSSYGYDVRLAEDFMLVLPNSKDGYYIDPKLPPKVTSSVAKDGPILIQPGQTILGRTIEKFHLPDDVIGHLASKSTYARAGLTVNFTVMEPGWSGELTVEISNLSNFRIAVHPGEGIGQVVFHRGQFDCETTYGDRKGKYQDQSGVTPFRLDSSTVAEYVGGGGVKKKE